MTSIIQMYVTSESGIMVVKMCIQQNLTASFVPHVVDELLKDSLPLILATPRGIAVVHGQFWLLHHIGMLSLGQGWIRYSSFLNLKTSTML